MGTSPGRLSERGALRMSGMRARTWTIGCGLIVVACGCGGKTVQGADASASDAGDELSTSGCGTGGTFGFAIDASVCGPQLLSSTTCQDGTPCSWVVAVECGPDGGSACDWCNGAAPNPSNGTSLGDAASTTTACQVFTQDGGTFARCGSCGM